jgi:cytoskeletal protein CcmA (bactofilin family)
MARQHLGAAALAALALSLAGGAARAAEGDSVSTVMGSITVNAGEHRGDLTTVNGSIHVGENAVVGEAQTVNGSVSLEPHATATEVQTVNGAVRLSDGAQINGRVHTVNGSLSLAKGANVTGALANVNGSIRVNAAHVGGDVETTNGGIEIGPDARIDGGITVRKNQSDHGDDMGSHNTPPRIVIGPGSVVKGTLRFERPVELYVSDRATIGPVEGATPVKFSGDNPPGSGRM